MRNTNFTTATYTIPRSRPLPRRQAYVPAQQDFLCIGHHLCNLLFALLGGLAGRVLDTTRDKQTRPAP